MSTLLALETSCDETAVAIMCAGELLASEVASQVTLHQAYGGVVPEVASRNHLVHAPLLLETAIDSAGTSLGDIDCFAATTGPGLASSLMIGTSIAKGLSIGWGKPYLAINHLEGHLLSPFFGQTVEPNVALIVSGGHTLLVQVGDVGDYRLMGRTVDDAAGEAFDKVAKLLGLGYPGGPEIERRAKEGDPKRFHFPRSMLDSPEHNFSFSGLKTSVRYELERHLVARDDRLTNDFCASFQAAAVEVLVRKTLAAAQAGRVSLVTLSGGVSCNAALCNAMRAACERGGLQFRAAPPQLSTDNAAMIAFAAMLRFERGFASDVAEEIDPNLALIGC
ncbi:MAG: tRNA (adenosine(37)-N6)-threonylcarbamoyltransferase complex transferase subunit TsaD [Chthoniobacterales bacterium]